MYRKARAARLALGMRRRIPDRFRLRRDAGCKGVSEKIGLTTVEVESLGA